MSATRILTGWVITWALLGGVWLLLTDTVSLPELAAGACVAAVAATASELVRQQRDNALRVPVRGLLQAWRPLARAPRDLVLVTSAVLRQVVAPKPQCGRLRALPFRHGGDAPTAHGRRALAEGLGSFAPNTIVVGIDEDRDVILVHQLVPTGDAASELDPLGLR